MSWRAYGLVLRLTSPLHVGWRAVGNLQQTRPYVPARTLLGAFTARLTRDAGRSDYRAVGEEVAAHLACTYLYPTTDPQGLEVEFPWSDADRFAWRFLGSHASTALASGGGPELGSLHETEYVAPRTRDGWPVYLAGTLFVREGWTLPWRDALPRLQLGAQRAYGWGRVRPESPARATDGRDHGLRLGLAGERPVVALARDEVLLAHASWRGVAGEGAVEPWLGRETDERAARFGARVGRAEVCWAPGTRLKEPARLAITRQGVWAAPSP